MKRSLIVKTSLIAGLTLVACLAWLLPRPPGPDAASLPGASGGRFVVELATCEDAGTGRVIKWPPAPLTLRGSFAGLPRTRR